MWPKEPCGSTLTFTMGLEEWTFKASKFGTQANDSSKDFRKIRRSIELLDKSFCLGNMKTWPRKRSVPRGWH